jgi:hypothetical protein
MVNIYKKHPAIFAKDASSIIFNITKKLFMTVVGTVVITLGSVDEVRSEIQFVPGNLLNTEGNSNNMYPFNFSGRYQQVFTASEFASFGEVALITQLAFRLDTTFGSAFSATIPHIQINLSTTQASVDGLSPIFADNIGADETVVLNGELSLASSFNNLGKDPQEFDVFIPLETPFLYDYTQGNLLLDVRNYSYVFIPTLDAHNVVGDSISRRWHDDVNSPTATLSEDGVDDGNPDNFSNSLGLVTQFTFESVEQPTAEVPEPGTALGVGVLGVLGWLLKKKRTSTKL